MTLTFKTMNEARDFVKKHIWPTIEKSERANIEILSYTPMCTRSPKTEYLISNMDEEILRMEFRKRRET